MVFGFVPLQEKQGAVQTHYVLAFITISFSVVSVYALIQMLHVYEQFVQDFVESHPICEVCEKILPKTQRSIVRILTYYNLHMCMCFVSCYSTRSF